MLITRTAVFELISALKFKTIIPDSNFLVLTNLVLQDAGGSVIEDIDGMYFHNTCTKHCVPGRAKWSKKSAETSSMDFYAYLVMTLSFNLRQV